MKYRLNRENLSKIINSEIVPEIGGFYFEIDSLGITVKKPYIDSDGDPMGDSILIDDHDRETMIFINLSSSSADVLFRENKKNKFARLKPDGPAHILKLTEQTWRKIVDQFKAFETLSLNSSFTFEKVFGIINSAIVPSNDHGWRFSVNDVKVAVQKTFTDKEDGQELGDSIHIDHDGELLFYIRVSKPGETPFLTVIYRENDENEFTQLTNESPKRIIHFFNDIWNEIILAHAEITENVLTYSKFKSQFGKFDIPLPLKALFDFESQFSLEQSFSECFYLYHFDKSGLKNLSSNENFLNHIIEFATANCTDSSYAFWVINDDLGVCPVVVLGDEGGYHIVAENILDLMQILTYDAEISVDEDSAYFHRDEDWHEQSENAELYRNWLKSNFNIDPTDDPAFLINKAQKKYKKQFDKWMKQYCTEE